MFHLRTSPCSTNSLFACLYVPSNSSIASPFALKMAKKVISKLFSIGRRHGCVDAPAGDASTSPRRQSFSSRLMEENIAAAETIILEWDPDSSNYAKVTPLFSGGRAEAARFLGAVAGLHRTMLFFSSLDCPDPPASRSQSLLRAQSLMQSAMRRLEQEFHRLLSVAHLDLDRSLSSFRSRASSSSSSSDNEDDNHIRPSAVESDRASPIADATADLRSIADAMISNGYGLECVRVHKLLRRSNLEEALFRLGFDLRLPIPHLHKHDWPLLDRSIRSWNAAAPTAFSCLFAGERLLCLRLFDANLIEPCFADVALDAALRFLSFPLSVAKAKPSPDKLLRILDLHETLSDLWPQIESTFSYDSTAAVRTKALDALLALANAARGAMAEFELAIQKDASRQPVPGGAVHPLTRYAMNHLAGLADYVPVIADVYAGIPFRPSEPLPEAVAPCPSTLAPVAVAERFAWLLLVLLCKLDHKAEFFKDVSLSYLFLANNVQYVVNKVRGSGLRVVLGGRWVERQEATARNYAHNYVRFGWGKAAAAADMAEFDEAFEAAAQEGMVVADAGMREEVRAAVEGMILPVCGRFYERLATARGGTAAAVVRYSPEVIRGRLSRAFVGSDG